MKTEQEILDETILTDEQREMYFKIKEFVFDDDDGLLKFEKQFMNVEFQVLTVLKVLSEILSTQQEMLEAGMRFVEAKGEFYND